MNTTENNKVIDTFMESKGEYISYKDQWGGEYWGEYIPNKYHSDWNCLMEVVEKIESLGSCQIDISVKWCRINYKDNTFSYDSRNHLKGTKIEAVYNACVEFINYYNKQNK